MDEQSTMGAPPAGLVRRLAALLYDILLLLAVLFVGTLMLLPLTKGEGITPTAQGPGIYFGFRAYLALLALGYFGLSWTRTGQTLGMKAWRIRLESGDGRTLGWRPALSRFAFGLALAIGAELGLRLAHEPGWSTRDLVAGVLLPFAVNYAWIAFDDRGRSLQDLVCRSRVVCLDPRSD